jgi:hypothetical protein
MAIKVKELKSDAIVDVKVNKSFYLMTKALSFNLVKYMQEKNSSDDYLKEVMTKSYEELDDLQRSFYTVALLLAEIERQGVANNLYEEKEILEPGDEGYVAPKQD